MGREVENMLMLVLLQQLIVTPLRNGPNSFEKRRDEKSQREVSRSYHEAPFRQLKSDALISKELHVYIKQPS